MEYIVLGQDGKEYGPVDGETLRKWVEHGRVFKDTQIRNALMKKWNEAGSLDFLEEAFKIQVVHEDEEEGVSGKLMGMIGLKKEHEVTPEKDVKTAFKYKYIPNPASAGQRIGAFVVDGLLMGGFAIVLFIIMNISAGTLGFGEFASYEEVMPVEEMDEGTEADSSKTTTDDGAFIGEDTEEKVKESKNDPKEAVAEPYEPFVPTDDQMLHLNNSVGFYLTIFLMGVFLYYGISLGIFAQTYGMWFWGIIIVKGYDDECFPARAFLFTVAMFAIGIVTPLVVLLNPEGRSLHGYLTGTRLIRVAAKPKA